MLRIHSVRSFCVYLLGALLLSACVQVGDEGEDVLAGAGETATLTPSENQFPAATQPSPSVSAAEQPPLDVDPVIGLPVASDATYQAVPLARSGALESNSSLVPSPSPSPSPSSTLTVASTEAAPAPAPTETSKPQPQPTTTQPPTIEATTTTSGSPGTTTGLTYKGVLATGDDSITAFDSARKVVKGQFLARGMQPGNLIELSRKSSEQVGGVRATTVAGIEQAMGDLSVADGDACILFITSHGSRQAWYIRGSNGLSPDKLDQILSASCGSRPTVALVSACYSGIFIDSLARPNRVVLTAASPVNTSFGCSPEATYTYWDGCLITHFPQATTWEDLYAKVTGCIEGKEASARVTPSRPQAHFGAEVANMPILGG